MMDRPPHMDRMLDAVREVWEGQPDLDFAALMGMLNAHGLTWGISDSDALDICMMISTTYPGALSKVAGQHSVLLANGTTAVLTSEQVVLLRGWQQPIWWNYESLVQAQVGLPLVLKDREGIEHRLDMIHRIEKTMVVEGMDTRVIELADASVILQRGHHARHFVRRRRDLVTKDYQVPRAWVPEEGKPARLLAREQNIVEFPAIATIILG
ncbi:hypothetical protein A4R63_01755 [Corynebacterium pseudotuberculosis]|uniref:hypothetical protein n=2 Tax=Corynebacterium pseudotuberculosis TaxID=1719 RepID=UPI00065E1E44|nr:hypothetical protein [Corynebacterium pseudotuberculosis]AFH90175.2 hypothetical protein CP31_02010 [Corynebacterium pseudotuberculosis 31]APB10309.1 hypothetical protein A4R72_01960 [Corynebacterium pseudotuberculosis]APB12357.1 hypothetical protein A4R71_01975 [Corynebacterium pseudotuberculosis]APB14403.1 hypothetical protein A4R68_01970 [Corynebacterium pseudotuberculosis]APB18498.1 hypothetical protein A4R66_01970 [Corynebacterium pseudotuberculosis]